MLEKPKLLWVGDAVCTTGFARVTHNIIPFLQEQWKVAVLGINYHGDPHQYNYPIFPASTNGREDMWGLVRLPRLVEQLKPDVVIVNNDPWNVIRFIESTDVPIISYMPIDSPNVRVDVAEKLNKAAMNIAYTQFGSDELLRAGVVGTRLAVVPHGVNSELYRPMSKQEARRKLGIDSEIPKDAYVVGNVNRNQPRKRLDLTIMAFAHWLEKHNIPDNTYLHLHCRLRDLGWDLLQLAEYFGLRQRIIVTDALESSSIDESAMPFVYNCFDVQISTTQGEGWGLTTHEGMACGIPQIVPEWSALGEWPSGAVRYVPISGLAVTAGGINSIGGVCSEEGMIKALDQLYRNPDLRAEYSKLAYERATETRFTWASVGAQMLALLDRVRGKPTLASEKLASGSLGALKAVSSDSFKDNKGNVSSIHG